MVILPKSSKSAKQFRLWVKIADKRKKIRIRAGQNCTENRIKLLDSGGIAERQQQFSSLAMQRRGHLGAWTPSSIAGSPGHITEDLAPAERLAPSDGSECCRAVTKENYW